MFNIKLKFSKLLKNNFQILSSEGIRGINSIKKYNSQQKNNYIFEIMKVREVPNC